jgi:putative transposase
MMSYPSDLSDGQWERLAPFLRPGGGPGRKRTVDVRQVVNALAYRLRTGCQWRMLPREYPDYRHVYYYFAKWTRDGTWERVQAHLRTQARTQAGRAAQPSAAIIDSQSAKATCQAQDTGFDGGKKRDRAQTASAGRHAGPPAHRGRASRQCA